MKPVLWDVVVLRRHGMRLRPGELALPQRGLLSLTDRQDQGTFRRIVREAQLWSPDTVPQSRHALLLPIFEPAVVRIIDGTLVLVGFELDSKDDRTAEHQQVWRCSPVVDA